MVGYLAIRFLLRFLANHTLRIFAYYRFALAAVVAFVLLSSGSASIAQADEVKKISAWAAILFAPTLVDTVYGMNFDHMPELHWTLGYPFALALMLVVSVSLYLAFKRRGWL